MVGCTESVATDEDILLLKKIKALEVQNEILIQENELLQEMNSQLYDACKQYILTHPEI